ncbi:2-hydroxyacid dehydrogenase [Pseudorhodoferax sp.]|uniref:2-hydroxyacid dehydrogenase n=1 Tax=Pseudorhodoferax sp. TaxID=1993553 RepID=UPI0039E5A0C9
MKIVFHGQNAGGFRHGFGALVGPGHEIVHVGDLLDGPGEAAQFAAAEVLIGTRLDASMPRLERLRLYHAPAAGTDMIDTARLPAGAALCNCHGHEFAIAEYVFAALLAPHVPLSGADADLRRGEWTYWAGRPNALRTELGSQTIGLLGFGHIAQAIARCARAFGMRVHAANRSPVRSADVDRAFALPELHDFLASVDIAVVTLPLVPETQGIVDAAALAAMRPGAVLVNVARGPVVDEQALYDALRRRHLGRAVIDTWYRYPTPAQPVCAPSRLDFAALDNVLMTPHMSGWTEGTVRRRQQTMADNIRRLDQGQPLVNRLQ